MQSTHTNAEGSTAQVAAELEKSLLMIVENYERSRDQRHEAGYLLEKLAKANRVHREMVNELVEKYEMLKWGKL